MSSNKLVSSLLTILVLLIALTYAVPVTNRSPEQRLKKIAKMLVILRDLRDLRIISDEEKKELVVNFLKDIYYNDDEEFRAIQEKKSLLSDGEIERLAIRWPSISRTKGQPWQRGGR